MSPLSLKTFYFLNTGFIHQNVNKKRILIGGRIYLFMLNSKPMDFQTIKGINTAFTNWIDTGPSFAESRRSLDLMKLRQVSRVVLEKVISLVRHLG